jgi:hypothetical protein
MPKKITVTFEKKQPKVNGRVTSPYGGSNNVRDVYVSEDGKYILKVDDGRHVHDDAGVYAGISKADRKYFVPILAHGYTNEGYSWSVQEFLPLDWNKSDDDEALVEDLEDKYGLNDIHENNWAIYKGQPVIFDYGL